MKKLLLSLTLLSVLTFSCFAKTPKQVDDWDENATVKPKQHLQKRKHISNYNGGGMGGNIVPVPAMVSMPAPVAMSSRKIGLAVGGAKDTHNFTDNIAAGYLPKMDAITYEGTYYNHYFETGLQGECQALFCPSYSKAMQRDLYSDEMYYYLSVGLNSGIDQESFKRKKLNVVVVLDISGSMGSKFNQYYYDKTKKRKNSDTQSKMEIANKAIVSMMGHLKPNDRFGVVLFDNEAYDVKPLRRVSTTNMKAIKKHVLALRERGGTNWSAGYKAGLDYFKKVRKKGYENRIIFITDAMPNSGELNKDRLFGMAKSASKKGIHTTFIGVGVDFNANLVEYVSKVKGANYYAVHSSKSFQKRMDAEFDYMVTPLVYDLELTLKSKGFKIDAVYGSPQANLATGTMMYVNTLFPSASNGKRTKGGVILVRLKKVGQSKHLTLSVKYKNTKGKQYKNVQQVQFEIAETHYKNGYYDNHGIQKAILLSEYVTLMKNWILDSRVACQDSISYSYPSFKVLKEHCMLYPPQRPYYNKMKTWERRSCKLEVGRGYKKLFSHFRRYYSYSMRQLKDKSLHQELKVLNKLLKQKSVEEAEKVDDWHTYFGR